MSAVCPEPEKSKELIRIPDKETRTHTANAARISHMIAVQRHTPEDRVFRAVRFHAINYAFALHRKAFTREFIVVSDGVAADVPAEVFAAIHEWFLDEPLPDGIDVAACIRRAKEFEAHGIPDAP